eukprot:403332122
MSNQQINGNVSEYRNIGKSGEKNSKMNQEELSSSNKKTRNSNLFTKPNTIQPTNDNDKILANSNKRLSIFLSQNSHRQSNQSTPQNQMIQVSTPTYHNHFFPITGSQQDGMRNEMLDMQNFSENDSQSQFTTMDNINNTNQQLINKQSLPQNEQITQMLRDYQEKRLISDEGDDGLQLDEGIVQDILEVKQSLMKMLQTENQIGQVLERKRQASQNAISSRFQMQKQDINTSLNQIRTFQEKAMDESYDSRSTNYLLGTYIQNQNQNAEAVYENDIQRKISFSHADQQDHQQTQGTNNNATKQHTFRDGQAQYDTMNQNTDQKPTPKTSNLNSSRNNQNTNFSTTTATRNTGPRLQKPNGRQFSQQFNTIDKNQGPQNKQGNSEMPQTTKSTATRFIVKKQANESQSSMFSPTKSFNIPGQKIVETKEKKHQQNQNTNQSTKSKDQTISSKNKIQTTFHNKSKSPNKRTESRAASSIERSKNMRQTPQVMSPIFTPKLVNPLLTQMAPPQQQNQTTKATHHRKTSYMSLKQRPPANQQQNSLYSSHISQTPKNMENQNSDLQGASSRNKDFDTQFIQISPSTIQEITNAQQSQSREFEDMCKTIVNFDSPKDCTKDNKIPDIILQQQNQNQYQHYELTVFKLENIVDQFHNQDAQKVNEFEIDSTPIQETQDQQFKSSIHHSEQISPRDMTSFQDVYKNYLKDQNKIDQSKVSTLAKITPMTSPHFNQKGINNESKPVQSSGHSQVQIQKYQEKQRQVEYPMNKLFHNRFNVKFKIKISVIQKENKIQSSKQNLHQTQSFQNSQINRGHTPRVGVQDRSTSATKNFNKEKILTSKHQHKRQISHIDSLKFPQNLLSIDSRNLSPKVFYPTQDSCKQFQTTNSDNLQTSQTLQVQQVSHQIENLRSSPSQQRSFQQQTMSLKDQIMQQIKKQASPTNPGNTKKKLRGGQFYDNQKLNFQA